MLDCVCFRFRTGRPEMGYSAHMAGGSTLVVETVGKTKKPQSHRVKFSFQPRHWYMLTVMYTYSRMRSCQMSCYVNSKCVLHVDTPILPPNDDVRNELRDYLQLQMLV